MIYFADLRATVVTFDMANHEHCGLLMSELYKLIRHRAIDLFNGTRTDCDRAVYDIANYMGSMLDDAGIPRVGSVAGPCARVIENAQESILDYILKARG